MKATYVSLQKYDAVLDSLHLSANELMDINKGKYPGVKMLNKKNDGSYLIQKKPPKLIITVKAEDGKIYSRDIYDPVIKKNGRERITNTFIEKLRSSYRYANWQVIDGLVKCPELGIKQ